jgi:hypothetical protein
LKSKGYKDLGSLEEFSAKINKVENRMKLCDALVRDGYFDAGNFAFLIPSWVLAMGIKTMALWPKIKNIPKN